MIKKIKIAEKMVLASSGVTGCAGGGAAGYAFSLSNMTPEQIEQLENMKPEMGRDDLKEEINRLNLSASQIIY